VTPAARLKSRLSDPGQVVREYLSCTPFRAAGKAIAQKPGEASRGRARQVAPCERFRSRRRRNLPAHNQAK
jgi:hypothetical protein